MAFEPGAGVDSAQPEKSALTGEDCHRSFADERFWRSLCQQFAAHALNFRIFLVFSLPEILSIECVSSFKCAGGISDLRERRCTL